LRSEELRDALWAICDSKHEEAEAARLNLAGDGSAAEHIGLLGQHLTSLAQVELDRWAATCAVDFMFDKTAENFSTCRSSLSTALVRCHWWGKAAG
jgi:hypothetical protein